MNARAFTGAGNDVLAGTYGPDFVYRTTNAGASWVGVGRGITGEGIFSLVARGGKAITAPHTRMQATTNLGSTEETHGCKSEVFDLITHTHMPLKYLVSRDIS